MLMIELGYSTLYLLSEMDELPASYTNADDDIRWPWKAVIWNGLDEPRLLLRVPPLTLALTRY